MHQRFFWITVFGVLGVLSRYGVGSLVGRFLQSPFPAGTFLINITGAFLIGVVYVCGVERAMLPNDLRVGLMVGFLGGYTTFSSYCLESAQLLGESQFGLAAVYFLLSPALGLLATFGGILLMRWALA